MTNILTNQLPDNLKAINDVTGPVAQQSNGGLGALDQGDFLKLLLTQLQQQDPLEPVNNEEMLAQMAQFTALAGSTQTNATLNDISAKLDALIEAQRAAIPATTTPSTTMPATTTPATTQGV